MAIKDFVRQDEERNRLDSDFHDAFVAAFRHDHVHLDCLHGGKDQLDDATSWNRYEWWQSRVIRQEPIIVHPKVSNTDAGGEGVPRYLLDYDVILIEMEYRTLFVGVPIVQWLAMAFDELEQSDRRRFSDGTATKRHRPQIIALSREEKPGHSYICLSHGAEAFAAKSRVFGIPALLTTARVGKWRVPAEPRNARPNFRALYGLLPDTSNRLRSQFFDDLILGDEWDRRWVKSLPKADLHFHMGTSISLATIDSMAYNTSGYFLQSIKNLERDSSRLQAALLQDVCKAVILLNLDFNYQSSIAKSVSPAHALWSATRLICRPLQSGGKPIGRQPPDKGILDDVIAWLTPRDRPYQLFETCSLLVAALHAYSRATLFSRNNKSGLAATLGDKAFRSELKSTVLARWSYFGVMSSVVESRAEPPFSTGLGRELSILLDYFMLRAERNWKHGATRNQISSLGLVAEQMKLRGTHAKKNSPASIAWWWSAIWEKAKGRVSDSIEVICDKLMNLLENYKWLGELMIAEDSAKTMIENFEHHHKNECPGFKDPLESYHGVDLADLVVIPDTVDGYVGDNESRSLARYLWGAGLLGAEHLQFPENLLLGAFDIVRQNVEDNVVYSEVRCATNGYCKAGLSPQDATDILCLGFDFASTFFGWFSGDYRAERARERFQAAGLGESLPLDWKAIHGTPPQRWVRTNVILGAKRHKNVEEFDEIVGLVRSYLDRGREPKLRARDEVPATEVDAVGSWWDRCMVVGFDLSGDETQQFPGLRNKIQPLFVVSAPITIHAGEAATAESIWDAVYSLGAARIGHGLRLRDDQKLLEYCSRRGICMELCPISNLFTNIYRAVRPADTIGDERKQRELDDDRSIFPLRAFLDAGLDVCLNTDNRSMHKRPTLTDEFLVAARFVGGITRWEALKIAKAGFKCAFLPKPEIAALLRYVEFEVYKLVSDHDADFEFRVPGQIKRQDHPSA